MQNKYLVLTVGGMLDNAPDALVLPLSVLGELRSLADTGLELRSKVKGFRSLEVHWDKGQWVDLKHRVAPIALPSSPVQTGDASDYEEGPGNMQVDETTVRTDGHTIMVHGLTDNGEFHSQPFHIGKDGKLVYWGCEGAYTVDLETGEVALKQDGKNA